MRRRERGFSLIELLIVVAIILIIAAIAVPNMIASRERASEAAAVQALRTLSESQAAYNVTYGQTVGYAGTLVVLGPGPTCDQTHACLVDQQLACGAQPCTRGNYNFFLTSDSSNSPFTDYAFTATPLTWGYSGDKNFCSAEDGIIRFQLGGTASLSSAVDHSTCINFAVYGSIQ